MGLENFNIAPDNKGGRKPGSGEEQPEPDVIQSAYTMEKDTEQWWQEVADTHVSGDHPTRAEMVRICQDLHILPRTAKQMFTIHGIFDYEEFVEDETGNTKDKGSILGRLSSGGSSADEDEGSKPSSGLQSLIDGSS